MFIYQKFLVKENDRFHPDNFPGIETSLQQVTAVLGASLPQSHTDMLVSYVKDHSINTKSVKAYPDLADIITSKALPLGVLEDLFESSGNNRAFQNGLEAHIRAYLSPEKVLS